VTALDLCSYLGLGAVGGATLTLLLGLLMSMRYSAVRHWPHYHRLNIFLLHRWLAYSTLALAVCHPLVLLFLHTPKFRVVDIVWPVHSFLQPKLNVTGAVALYLLLLIVISSLLRHRIGRPIWRRLHYLAFPAAAALFLHSILTDPLLKDGKPDLLDGGKVFIEIAFLLSAAAVAARFHLRRRGLRPAPKVSEDRVVAS
jgi:predicted ferric reductase